GYQKLPGGMVIQWGKVIGGGEHEIVFPIQFLRVCLNMSGTYISEASGKDFQYAIKIHTASRTGATLWTNTDAFWIAIGC
ncbi:gp53-like domain-containing protein, partial [Pectobacterium cacticida]